MTTKNRYRKKHYWTLNHCLRLCLLLAKKSIWLKYLLSKRIYYQKPTFSSLVDYEAVLCPSILHFPTNIKTFNIIIKIEYY